MADGGEIQFHSAYSGCSSYLLNPATCCATPVPGHTPRTPLNKPPPARHVKSSTAPVQTFIWVLGRFAAPLKMTETKTLRKQHQANDSSVTNVRTRSPRNTVANGEMEPERTDFRSAGALLHRRVQAKSECRHTEPPAAHLTCRPINILYEKKKKKRLKRSDY